VAAILHEVFYNVTLRQLFNKLKSGMVDKRSLIQQAGNDDSFMSRALALADNVKGFTFPNPSVGAVIVKNGAVIGTGATSECGGPHAEINALKKAGAGSRGATMYVTLEPCCHFGKTGPCTEGIIRAGIKRVCVSVADPNPLVKGRGIRLLRKNGIHVEVGLREKEATRINEDFFFWIVKKRPWISVKLAMTLDGRIADDYGDSKWITSTVSRKFDHGLRARHAGIAVGRTTLEKDNPRLTVRYAQGNDPVRFVFTSTDEVSSGCYFVRYARQKRGTAAGSVLVVRGGRSRSKQRRSDGVEVWHTGECDTVRNLHAFCDMAFEENICSMLVEGGGKLASSFIENRLANRLYLWYGNKIIGKGIAGMEFSKGLPVRHCLSLDEIEINRFGPDAMITGIPRWR
jgi:diaminohydroxyphosphoribosylaminopyrimidine deaminase/5-amino-6-(5-phosphoribosylamino)uracil reductase